ncbi:MAG: hypothetical protein A3E83_06510 [Gammaproteobacteria bacterium RIFCSPHIGHO2_12_FULL_41_20]|nr:MAG: hypothetical protein A3E83_06510 [Gammaproteobacteria bacterium RIFCSPHIGHO2_12_FULL_41_20]
MNNKGLFAASLFFLSEAVLAVDTPQSALPSTSQPSQVQRALISELPKQQPTPTSIQEPTQAEASQVGEQAKKITFKLTNIILTGNHVYSHAQLERLYIKDINQIISVADLYNIVQRITNYYRNNGYILSRAILPPQHVAHGVVRVQVIEGFISKANVIGEPKYAKSVVERYAQHIVNSRPLQLKVMEHYLLIANEIPGVQTKAVLEPSKTIPAAAELNLQTETKTVTGFLSYDDYGTRYIGPQQITLNLGTNSLWVSGDTLQGIGAKTPKGMELSFYDVSYNVPISNEGLRWIFDTNKAMTNPLFTLAPLKINGTVMTYDTQFQYPVIRTPSKSLTVQGGFNYMDSQTLSFDAPLYLDHLRTLTLGTTYNFADSLKGVNGLTLTLGKGIPLFGATISTKSLTTSRYGASGVFTDFNFNYNRLQTLFWRFSLYGVAQGQYSFNPLLVSQQFAYGGSQLGRGYDPAEITGDDGLAGSVELRFDLTPGWRLLQSIQIYTFYDVGETWYLKQVSGQPPRQSATSTGGGIRFSFNEYLSGNFMIAQPLTRKVAAEELIGNGRLPRTFFSIVAML